MLRPPPGPPHAPAWPRLVPATPMPSTCPLPTPMGSRGVCGLQGLREVASSQVPQQSWSPRSQGLHCPGTSWHHPQKLPSWAQGPSQWLQLCGSNKKIQGWLGHGGHPLATSYRRARSPGTLPLTTESRRLSHLCGPWEGAVSRPSSRPPPPLPSKLGPRGSALHQVPQRQSRWEDGHSALNSVPREPQCPLHKGVRGLSQGSDHARSSELAQAV